MRWKAHWLLVFAFLTKPALGQVRPVEPPLELPPMLLSGGLLGSDAGSASSQKSALTNDSSFMTFDTLRTEVRHQDGRWQLWADGRPFKDFPSEQTARQALWILRELGLNQRGAVGTPRPVMEYWLSNGQAPRGSVTGVHLLPFRLESVRAERVQGQWIVHDGHRPLFNFGTREEEARQAIAILKRYGFNQIGYLGAGVPSMMLPVAGGKEFALGRSSASSRPIVAKDTDPNDVRRTTMKSKVQNTFLKDLSDKDENALKAAWLQCRQLNQGSPLVHGMLATERLSFDWRHVQLRQERSGWKLVDGSDTLADFGDHEDEARQGLDAFRHYRFTERCTVGAPGFQCTYYLSSGRAPHGSMLGLKSLSFRPDILKAQQQAGSWSIVQDGRPLLNFGPSADAARKMLQIIHEQKFDRLCSIGRLSFFVRAN